MSAAVTIAYTYRDGDALLHAIGVNTDIRRCGGRRGLVHPNGRLNLAHSNEPTDGARYLGHDADEDLIRVWSEAVTAFLHDADVPLPPFSDSAGVIDRADLELRRGASAASRRKQGGV